VSFDGLNRRMLDYQLSCGPVCVQVVSPFTACGYSADVDEIIGWATELDSNSVGASAIYTNVNPCAAHHPDFRRAGAVWTKNADIARRRTIFIDADACDPARPVGYCATDHEVDATLTVMKDSVRPYLLDHGVSPNSLALAASGNGTNLLLFVDWECDARTDAAVTNLLRGLSGKVNTAAATIDTSVGDRRRIRKFYGCQTRKQTAPGRPWRRSGVLELPELSAIELVPLETVESIVMDLGIREDGSGQAARPSPTVPGSIARQIALLERWADAYGFPGILFVKSPDSKGAVTVVLDHCPRNPEHTGTSAAMIFFPDGGRGCACHHNTCKSLPFKEWWAEVEALHGHPLKFERELIRR
jgi:hypothetical protein